MSTVEAFIKIRGDTSQFQSVLNDAGKATDRFADNFKKRMDMLNRLKISPRISIIDNATDALKKIEQLSNRVKSSLSSISVSVNVSAVEQAVSKFEKGTIKKNQEVGSNTIIPSPKTAHTLAVVAGAAPFILAHESWKKSRTPAAAGSETLDPSGGRVPATGDSLFKKVLPKLAKEAGRAFAPLSIAQGLVGVVQSDNKGKAAAELVGGIAGGILGAVAGPFGSFAGSVGGKLLAGNIYNKLWGKEDEKAAKTSNAVSDQQERIASTGQVYLDSQNNIVTSNGFVINSQNNLMNAFTTLAQAVDFASAKLIAFSGVQYTPPPLPSKGVAGGSYEEFKKLKGYAAGGILSRPHLGLVAEAGPEAIIPLSSRMRSRALALWQQAGEYLGVRPYAAGGFAGVMPGTAVAGGGANITVPVNVNLQVSGENIDYESIKNEVGWRIAKSIKNALENRSAG